MAGLSTTGLTIKRLPEITTELEKAAEQIFADLAPSGDVVDTTANTTIGRLIGLVAPSHADIWEALQDVHNSFSAQHATGIALDNIVALSGIARLPQTRSRANCLFEGSNNTTLSLNAKVSSSTTRRIFTPLAPVLLNPTQCVGAGITVPTAAAATAYTVSFSSDGIAFTNVTYTTVAAPTPAIVLNGLKAAFDATYSASFSSVIIGAILWIARIDPFQPVTFTTTPNITVSKIRKLAVVECDEAGAIIQFEKTIDTIAVPTFGWDSVYNPLEASIGRAVETDPELRERFRLSKYFQAQNIIESLIDALKTTPNVTDVIVYENDTDTTNAFGVTPHAFMPIVLGGLTTTIGEAIWQNKPTGIKSVGNTTVSVADSQGIQHSISFMRPLPVRLYVKLSVTSTGLMAGNIDVLLKDALAAYILENNKIGTDLIYSRLYTPINSLPGFQINSLTLGTAPNPVGTSNIIVPFDSVAQLATADITVTIV